MATKKANRNVKPKTKPKAAAKKATTAGSGNEALRNLFLAGIGLADETNAKLQTTFSALVKKGKAKEPHVKNAVAEARKKALARRKQLEKKFQDFLKKNDLLKKKDELLKKRDELLKSKEVQELKKKIQALETKVREAARKAVEKPVAIKPQTKPAVKKTVTPVSQEQPAAMVTPSVEGVSVSTQSTEETAQ